MALDSIENTILEKHDLLVVLDFGSQYAHLIARRLRDGGFYSELYPYNIDLEQLKSLQPKGIILSGGPASVYSVDSPHADRRIFSLGIPILGICYGMQEIAHQLGGVVEPGNKREYGHACLHVKEDSGDGGALFRGLSPSLQVWMSHGDRVTCLPQGFQVIAHTENCEYAVVYAKEAPDLQVRAPIYGLQFHPEVTHTESGAELLGNFCRYVCGCRGDWCMEAFVDEAIRVVRERVGDTGIVIGALSGGVDSTVAAVLVSRAVGDRFRGIFVDNGLLRKNEAIDVMKMLKEQMHVHVDCIDASKRFLDALADVSDPEEKRKIIGKGFIEVFEEQALQVSADYLLQGTLYPDVIESVSYKGPSATIKTHHNVGGLPERMKLELIEPLRYLFKDEARKLGIVLGLAEEVVYRHPFPGPGLAIRILGKVNAERLQKLREADAIYLYELRAAGLYQQIGQAFAVLLPCKAVGVMGDFRTYEEVIALRAVATTDYMTADWYPIPFPVLRRISLRIVNEVSGVNRVVYDITSKPPATIEWE
jgi:GMP synthase (glutamine-hydrolysing)